VQAGSELQRETLLSRAETALYRAKCLGRNRVCLHGPATTASGRYLNHA
jgi:PleD family two-component response regulator